jgi:hypothetical protein
MHHTWASYILLRLGALFAAAESPSVGLGDAINAFAQAFESLSKKSQTSGVETVRDFKQHYYASAVLGGLALLSIIVAFVLLMVFATKNAALL